MRCKWLVLNGSAWAQEEDEGLRALLKYIESGIVTEGDELVKQIDRLVLEANNDERVKGEMISVSTVEENAERRVRMAKKFYREEGLEEGRAEGASPGNGSHHGPCFPSCGRWARRGSRSPGRS